MGAGLARAFGVAGPRRGEWRRPRSAGDWAAGWRGRRALEATGRSTRGKASPSRALQEHEDMAEAAAQHGDSVEGLGDGRI